MRCAMVGRVLCIVCVTAFVSTAVAYAGGSGGNGNGCQTVNGQVFEVEVPANELNNPIPPHGRVVAEVTGTLKGAETAILTGFAPTPPGSPPGAFAVTTQNVFVTRKNVFATIESDMLVTTGLAVLSFNPDGTVNDDLTLTVDGASSKGKFAGTTGTIRMTGTGFNFLGGPGVGRFEFRYHGQICGIKDEE